MLPRNGFMSCLAVVFLFFIESAYTGELSSPEALAMSMTNAYRSGNVGAIVALHYFVPTQNISIAKQRANARREWRALIKQFQISGYRLSILSAVERQQLAASGATHPVPIKKLIITLLARHAERRQVVTYYIVYVAGRYVFVESKDG